MKSKQRLFSSEISFNEAFWFRAVDSQLAAAVTESPSAPRRGIYPTTTCRQGPKDRSEWS
jgi:hypothetical protein